MFNSKGKKLLALLMITGLALKAQEKTFSLNSSNTAVHWKIKAASEVGQEPGIYTSRYNDNNWINAVVPGTVFGAFVAAGLEKDPNFGDNIYQVDKKKYDRDFWYSTTFTPTRNNGGEAMAEFRRGEPVCKLYCTGNTSAGNPGLYSKRRVSHQFFPDLYRKRWKNSNSGRTGCRF